MCLLMQRCHTSSYLYEKINVKYLYIAFHLKVDTTKFACITPKQRTNKGELLY